MQRLSVRQTREGSFRVGHDKRHVIVNRAANRQKAHRKGKRIWHEKYGTVASITS